MGSQNNLIEIETIISSSCCTLSEKLLHALDVFVAKLETRHATARVKFCLCTKNRKSGKNRTKLSRKSKFSTLHPSTGLYGTNR